MTIGIGLICQQGKCVLMAADGKGSFDDSAFPSHDRIGKQMPLPFGLCINIAGPVNTCHSLMNRMATALESLKSGPTPDLDVLMDAIERARHSEIVDQVDHEMKSNLLMSVEEWRALSAPTLQYRRGANLIKRYIFPAEFLLGGFVFGNSVVIQSIQRQKLEATWMSCIGSGGDAAYRRLVSRSQNVHMSLPRTLVHLTEAMYDARQENQDTVGPPSDYVVITQKQVRRMPSKDTFLLELTAKYADRDSQELDSDGAALNAILSALYLPGTTKEDYARGLRAPKEPMPSEPQTSEDQR